MKSKVSFVNFEKKISKIVKPLTRLRNKERRPEYIKSEINKDTLQKQKG